MAPEPTNTTIESLLAHASWLDALARRLVSDPNEADEIVQETWVTALSQPPRHTAQLRAWMARVARNLAVDRGRSERARKEREQSIARTEASTADRDALDRARTLRRLVDAVLALDEPYRSTIVLHYFERMSIAEVAARQSVRESTVRTRLWRAIGILRERFRHEAGDTWSLAFVALVTKHAAHPHGAISTAAATTSSALIGGIAMTTAWKVGASLAAVIVLGWVLWPKHDDSIVRGLDVARSEEKPVESLSTAGAEPAARVPLASKPAGEVVESAVSTAPKSDRASLDVHVKWGDDNTPAAGIVVGLYQFGAHDPKHERPFRTTDADGSAHFDDVYPGSTIVEPDRCQGNRVTLAAGDKAVCDLVIPDGMDVDVRVVDEDAAVVPRARIWVSAYGNSTTGLMIGTADGSGRLRVRDLAPGRALAALCNDHGPSPQTRVEPRAPGSRVDLELVMTTPIGRLRGTVRDRSGAPIAGAALEMSNREGMFSAKPKPGQSYEFPPMLVITDASGAFDARDIGRGGVDMNVSARGFATLNQRVGASENADPLDIRMDVQAIVHGIVRDAGGAPLSNVRVSYTDEKYWGLLKETSSSADGKFRIDCLPAGSVELYVDAGKIGEARRTFDLKAGDDVTWDVTLRPNSNVTGRVVDQAGKPIAGWSVNAVNPDPPEAGLRKAHALRTSRTDAQGKFEIENWPMEAVALQVCEPNKPVELLSVQHDHVKAGDQDVVITVTPDDMHSGAIVGRVIDESGAPLSKTPIQWNRVGVNQYMPVKTGDDGRFRVEAMQPGTYAIEVIPEGLPARTLGELKVTSNQVLDVGDVQISGAGNLKVRLHLHAELKPDQGSPMLTLFKVDASTALGVHLNGDVGTLESIEPGEYELRLFSPWLHAPITKVTIELHRTTEIELTVEAGTMRGVKFDWSQEGTQPKSIVLRVFDSGGTRVFESSYPSRYPNGAAGNLTIGTYRMEATTDTGLTAKEALRVDSLEIPQSVIPLHLR